MPIQVGDKIPDVSIKTMADGGMQDVSTTELCAGKKVVLFAVPGAFTPTCSMQHLPSFIEQADAIKAYVQAKLTGPKSWVSLPQEYWPAHFHNIRDPVVPLEYALYGHPGCRDKLGAQVAPSPRGGGV